VYFGDDPKSDSGDGVIVPTTVTAGNTFRFDLFIENEGNQRLTHAEIGYGSLAVARQGSNPSLPSGASIVSATLNGLDCMITPDDLGALCDLGQFDAGETATAEFIVNAPRSTQTPASTSARRTPTRTRPTSSPGTRTGSRCRPMGRRWSRRTR
jgi:hypothetical protein